MKLGILNDQKMFGSGDSLMFEDPFVNFLVAFREHFELVFLSRVFPPSPDTPAPYSMTNDGVSVVEFPPYPRIVDLYKSPLKYWPAIDAALDATLPTLDALWLNFGHPISIRALRKAKKYPNLQCFAVMRGAYAEEAMFGAGGKTAVARIAGLVASRNLRVFTKLAREANIPCVAFGDEHADRLQQDGLRTKCSFSSLLSKKQIEEAPDSDPALFADLLTVGWLSKRKGVDVLLRAMPNVRNAEGKLATLRVVGSGDEQDPLRELAQELGLTDRVFFDGAVRHGEALIRRYVSTSIVVIPSRAEGTPKSATEAMAFGRPVISTTVGGLPKTVGTEGQRGLLVPADDVAALTEAMSSLLADPERRAKMSQNAREFGASITTDARVRAIVEHVAPQLLETS